MPMPLETKPILLQISDPLSLRYQKTGEGLPLVLLHRIFPKSGTRSRQIAYGLRHRSSWTRSFADRSARALR